MDTNVTVRIASGSDTVHSEKIAQAILESKKLDDETITERSAAFIAERMAAGEAVIAFAENDEPCGFYFLEAWEAGTFVSHSGLVVFPDFRKRGIATAMASKLFELGREKYPQAKLFLLSTPGWTTKITTRLGYVPRPYSEITQDDTFWTSCAQCPNHNILENKKRKLCLCKVLLYTDTS